MTEPKAPPSLKAAGRRLWRAVMTDYELTEPESKLLELACQACDDAAAARVALQDGPIIIVAGAARVHPAATAARQAETSITRMLQALHVIDPQEKAARTSSTPGPKPKAAR